MKNSRKFGVALSLVVLFVILVPSFSPTLAEQVQCPDVFEEGRLRVLTINLLFSEVALRDFRLNRIADYVREQEELGNPIHLILLQEVVGGPLSWTVNSSLDLKNKLAERSILFSLRYRLANGLPGVLTVGNAILSRCKIVFTLSRSLPFVTEVPFDSFEIPLRRKVMMVRIKIPGQGKINVYNTHLCAFCDPTERLLQANALLDFMDDVEGFIWWDDNPIILGGDFNSEPGQPVHERITDTEGFTDTYASVNTCTDCCDEGSLPGCTFGDLDTGNNPFVPAHEKAKRIDYIFSEGVEPTDSVVPFQGAGNWVSDHLGTQTTFSLD